MATKKCPKCGEDNPAEAVMCWACYTPLTGGPSLAAAAVAPIAGAATQTGRPVSVADDSKDKKALDPKLIALVAIIFVGGGIAAVVNMGMGGGGEDGAAPQPTDPPPGGPRGPGGPGGPPGPPAPPPPGPGFGGGGGGGQAVAAMPMPYSVKSPPNPEYATGTVGIVSNRPTLTVMEARGLARFAQGQISRNGRWKNWQIAVFTDDAAARTFSTYQAKRRGAPLSSDDYRALADQNVWQSAPAFLESRDKRAPIYYAPSANPGAWWAQR